MLSDHIHTPVPSGLDLADGKWLERQDCSNLDCDYYQCVELRQPIEELTAQAREYDRQLRQARGSASHFYSSKCMCSSCQSRRGQPPETGCV